MANTKNVGAGRVLVFFTIFLLWSSCGNILEDVLRKKRLSTCHGASCLPHASMSLGPPWSHTSANFAGHRPAVL
jgi:hypothetical protein